MTPIERYPTSISDGISNLGSLDALISGSTYNEAKGNKLIVTTLYAKPSSSRPFLTISELKRGVYKETSYLSLRGFILFSDIGNAAWNAALEVNRNTTIQLVKTSILEEDKSWQVMIKNPDLIGLVNSNRFKPIGNYTSSFYISLEVCSEPAPLITFVKRVIEFLNRKPWENESGELDWGKFTKKSYMPRNEVIEQWATLSDSPELSHDYLKETLNPVCGRCKKTLEKEWILCPFCGEPKKYHNR